MSEAAKDAAAAEDTQNDTREEAQEAVRQSAQADIQYSTVESSDALFFAPENKYICQKTPH